MAKITAPIISYSLETPNIDASLLAIVAIYVGTPGRSHCWAMPKRGRFFRGLVTKLSSWMNSQG